MVSGASQPRGQRGNDESGHPTQAKQDPKNREAALPDRPLARKIRGHTIRSERKTQQEERRKDANGGIDERTRSGAGGAPQQEAGGEKLAQQGGDQKDEIG